MKLIIANSHHYAIFYLQDKLIKRYNVDHNKCEIIDMPLTYLSDDDTKLDNNFIDIC